MAHDGDGKGPGYALMWGGVALLLAVPITLAGWWGYTPWWGAAGADALIVGGFAALMLTATWA